MTRAREHDVAVLIDGIEVRGWSSYDINTSMLDPCDRFSMSIPFDRLAWDRLIPDRPIRVTIDGVVVVDGFLDDREVMGMDDELQISGRDRVGRLLNESAPGINFSGLDMKQLVAQLASPWFHTVTFSNARNRYVLRGKGKKARAGRDAVYVSTAAKSKLGSRIEPGQTRYQVIEDLCQQAEILVWSAGDGRELILGLPNYDQEPQFRFFMPAADSVRAGAESNVLGMSVKESTGDRYSEIIVVGSGGGTESNYGTSVSQRAGRAVNEADFSAPKRLVIEKAVASAREATAYARREMRRRDQQGRRVHITAPWHGQRVAGQHFTIFAPDLACSVEDERTGIAGIFHIVGCTFRSTREGGEETALEMVPRGTELAV